MDDAEVGTDVNIDADAGTGSDDVDDIGYSDADDGTENKAYGRSW